MKKRINPINIKMKHLEPTHAVRRDNFDAIRLLAAIIVIYGHAFPLNSSASIGVMGNSVQTLAVKVFFILSGYLISESWRRDPNLYRYFIRRSLRIFPALIAVVLLSAIVLGPIITTLPLNEYFNSAHLPNYLFNVFLKPYYSLPGVFENNIYPNAVNGSLWSLPVEFIMYMLVPCILWVSRWRRLGIIVSTLVFCGLAIYLTHDHSNHADIVFYGTSFKAFLNVAPYFLLGATWRILIKNTKIFNVQIALLVMILLCLLPAEPILLELALYLALPYLVLTLALASPAIFWFAGKWGDFSYGVYLYGFVVQQVIIMQAGGSMHPFANFVLALPITLCLAALSWHLLEKKLMAFKPKRRSALPSTANQLSPN